MKILLKNSVRSLGQAGDIVSVKRGYARNFLLPKGIAVPASLANVALIEKLKVRRVEEEAELTKTYQDAAEKIKELHIVLHMKANASNHLYGSVSAGEIVTQLNNRHIIIEKEMVQLELPIKELGSFTVPIRFSQDIEASLSIEIRDEHGEIPVLEGFVDLEEESEQEEEDQVDPSQVAADELSASSDENSNA